MDLSQLKTGKVKMTIVGLCLSKARYMVLVVFTWVELKDPIPECFLQRHTSQRPLHHKAGPIGVMMAPPSKNAQALTCPYSFSHHT